MLQFGSGYEPPSSIIKHPSSHSSPTSFRNVIFIITQISFILLIHSTDRYKRQHFVSDYRRSSESRNADTRLALARIRDPIIRYRADKKLCPAYSPLSVTFYRHLDSMNYRTVCRGQLSWEYKGDRSEANRAKSFRCSGG